MEKRPRHYATEALKIEKLEERRQFIENDVPEKYRETVKHYLVMWWANRKEVLASVEKQKALQARK